MAFSVETDVGFFFYFSRISIFATNPKNRYPLVAMSIKLNTKLESDLNSNNAMQRYWGFKSQFFPNLPNPRSLLKIYIKDTLTIIRNYFENLKVGRTFIGVSIFESFWFVFEIIVYSSKNHLIFFFFFSLNSFWF